MTYSPVALSDVPRSDPWETVRRGTRLISPKTGIISRITSGIHHAQDPAIFTYGISAGDLSRVSDIANSGKAGGAGESRAPALAATIGEAVERYCMLFYDRRSMIRATYREVEADAVHPDALRIFSREQVEEAKRRGSPRIDHFDEDSRINWVWGTSLATGRPRLVPASLVYLNYRYEPDEPAVGRNASSGLAAGATVEEAILTGLCELIERDAFTIRWARALPGRRVEVDDEELLHVMRTRFHLDHRSVELRAYEITTDVQVPSIFLTLRRPSEFGPALCVGTATRLEPAAALRKCLHEAGQALPYYRFLLSQLASWEPREDFTDLTAFDYHCVLYQKRPELVERALAPWNAVQERVLLSDLPDPSTGRVLGDLRAAVRALEPAGVEPVAVEITTPDILDVGLRVVRVLTPGLVPLHGNHNLKYLGVRRLHEVPEALHAAGKAGPPCEGINPFPHPFP